MNWELLENKKMKDKNEIISVLLKNRDIKNEKEFNIGDKTQYRWSVIFNEIKKM